MIPWKFILLIITLLVLIVFVGANIENNAEIRYWFGDKGEKTVNVVFALFGAFLFGVVVTLPYVFRRKVHYVDLSREHKKEKKKSDKKKKREAKKGGSDLGATENDLPVNPDFEFQSLKKSSKK